MSRREKAQRLFVTLVRALVSAARKVHIERQVYRSLWRGMQILSILGVLRFSNQSVYRTIFEYAREIKPDFSRSQLSAVARDGVLHNLWHRIFFMARMDRELLSPTLIRELVQVEGQEHLIRELHADGKGVIFVMGHLAFQSLIPKWLQAAFECEGMLIRPFPKEKTKARMRRAQSIVAARQVLLNNGWVGILPDGVQATRMVHHRLFNRLVAFSPGFAVLAELTGASLVPLHVLCERDGGFRLVVGEALPSPAVGVSGKAYADHMLCQYVDWLERVLSEHPEHIFFLSAYRYLRAKRIGG